MRRKRSLAPVLRLLLAALAVFGAVNAFWFAFRYLPYRRMADRMLPPEDGEMPRYVWEDGEYIYRLKIPPYLSFQSGFAYVGPKDEGASFIVDGSGNLTEKNVPHTDMFFWPQMFSKTKCGATLYEETFSVQVITDLDARFLPDSSLSETEQEEQLALFERHENEVRDLIRAALELWGDELN